jgi:glycerophosphoryl diester phosphodiesterase
MKQKALTVLLFALACTSQAYAQPALIEALKDGAGKPVLVAAHRAAHDIFPENSLAAIERAIVLGVDIIEIDVRLTRDGVPILMHDDTVDRMTDGTGKVRELTFAQVRELHMKGRDGAPSDHRVPTLSEALRVARGRVLVDLDLKTTAIEPVISRVLETGTIDQVLLFNGNYEVLQQFLKIAPDALVFPRAHSTEQAMVASSTLRPEAIHIDEGFNTDATHQAGLASDSRLWINALGDPDKLVAQGKAAEGINPLLAHGASIIQTDYPEAVMAYLEGIGRR